MVKNKIFPTALSFCLLTINAYSSETVLPKSRITRNKISSPSSACILQPIRYLQIEAEVWRNDTTFLSNGDRSIQSTKECDAKLKQVPLYDMTSADAKNCTWNVAVFEFCSIPTTYNGTIPQQVLAYASLSAPDSSKPQLKVGHIDATFNQGKTSYSRILDLRFQDLTLPYFSLSLDPYFLPVSGQNTQGLQVNEEIQATYSWIDDAAK